MKFGKRKRSAFASLLAVVIVGCGGSGAEVTSGSGNNGGGNVQAPQPDKPAEGGGGSAPLPVPGPCSPTIPVKIQLFGDSTLWGYAAGGGGVRAALYPELVLQRLMDAQYGAGTVLISTRAVSGTTSGQLLAGTDGLNMPWPQSVSADIIVINHGINDMRRAVPLATYRDNLVSLAKTSAKVVFQTPFPVYPPTVPSQDYSKIMLAVASDLNLPVIDAMAYALSVQAWKSQYATDGIHATGPANELIGLNVQFPVLSSLVKPLLCR